MCVNFPQMAYPAMSLSPAQRGEISREFLAWLRRHMDAREYKKSQVALYAGVDPSTVTGWFAGSLPRLEARRALARHFKVPLSSVPGGSDDDELGEDVEMPEVPAYLAELISRLEPPEQDSLADMAKTLLALRERRAAYDASDEDEE